jgi:hypothetical protein
MRWGVLLIAVMFAVTAVAAEEAAKEEPKEKAPTMNVEMLPASVIKTVPAAGDTRVDPNLKEIRVTFSKDMTTEKSWSWVQMSTDTFPKITGDVHYVDKRTCVAPVTLEAGRTYVIWFNSGKFANFKDSYGIASVPYLLVFQTKEEQEE